MDAVEKAFHRILRLQHTEGEWFNIEKDDVVPMLECLSTPNHPPTQFDQQRHMGKERSGRTTPQSAFYGPIVEVLRELGGKGQAKDVVERVGRRMELRSADYERSAGGTIVWKHTVHSARFYLKSKGTLKSNAPHGWWELADRVLRAVEAETQAAEAARLRESRRATNAPKGTPGVSQADEIRRYAIENYVTPWRESGNETLAIRAGDVEREMALRQATPNVCSALEGRKFQAQANLVLASREGPRRSTTTTYYYRQS